jgi:hypothetical protein
MFLKAIRCPCCYDVEKVKRRGATKSGTQLYRCYASRKYFLKDYTNPSHIPEVKTPVNQMAMSEWHP